VRRVIRKSLPGLLLADILHVDVAKKRSSRVKVTRSPENPVIEPKDVKPSREGFEVVGVFNAGVARLEDEVILLLRVAEKPIVSKPGIAAAAVYDLTKRDIIIREFPKDDPDSDFSDPRLIIRPGETYLTSFSHLRLAQSSNGIDFEISAEPTVFPANEHETFGIEDARIARIEDVYYIDYVAVSPNGVTTCLASTKDFESFQRHGVIFPPENKDVVLFPERIRGLRRAQSSRSYFCLHRPSSPLFAKNDIWIAQSPDLLSWGNHRWLMAPRPQFWDSERIGAGAPPVKIEQGWLEVYHGVDRAGRYSLGAALLDAQNPSKVIARSKEPLLSPEADYEVSGFYGNVVFSCGLLCEDDKLKLYYGAADCSVCYAELPLDYVLQNLKLNR